MIQPVYMCVCVCVCVRSTRVERDANSAVQRGPSRGLWCVGTGARGHGHWHWHWHWHWHCTALHCTAQRCAAPPRRTNAMKRVEKGTSHALAPPVLLCCVSSVGERDIPMPSHSRRRGGFCRNGAMQGQREGVEMWACVVGGSLGLDRFVDDGCRVVGVVVGVRQHHTQSHVQRTGGWALESVRFSN